MTISHVELTAFRNFKGKKIDFASGINIIVGPNGAGKTNILESVFFAAIAKSFKAKVEQDVINYESDIARIKALIKNDDKPETKLELVITRGLIDIGGDRPEKVARKKLLVGGVAKRMVDFAGNFRVVLFGPWDLDLVTESPSIRRKFLDTLLSQTDREYRRSLLSYEKGLRQRNRLLYKIREEGLSHSQLLFWNKLLIKNGDYITSKREEFINFVNHTPDIKNESFNIIYDKSAISEERLNQYAKEEIAAATTLVGPHRDDFVFEIVRTGRSRELASFGSRGEQRMGVLWLKLAEMSYIEKATFEKPTLLLDDIFSELDHEHRDVVMSIISEGQTIITTADGHFIENFEGAKIINL